MKEWGLSAQLIQLGHKVGPEYRFECPVCGQTFADILRYLLACVPPAGKERTDRGRT